MIAFVTGYLWKWAALAALFMVAAVASPAVKVKGWGAALGAALVFGVANVAAWVLLFPLVFVPDKLTFGLFGFLLSLPLNAIILRLADNALGEDMEVKSLPALASLAGAISLGGALLF